MFGSCCAVVSHILDHMLSLFDIVFVINTICMSEDLTGGIKRINNNA